MILDEWEELPIYRLTHSHSVNLFGQELNITHVGPAKRGGDFWSLEAIGVSWASMHSDDGCADKCRRWRLSGAITLEIDKNQKIRARLAKKMS